MSEPAGERRVWPRIPGSLLTNVHASLIAGPDVTLVNISRGGALLEVGARYPMRASVRLKLTRSTGETAIVPGTVSWSRVGAIAGGRINYLVAVIFEQAIADLSAVTGWQPAELVRAHDTPAPVPDAPVPTPAADPHPAPARPLDLADDKSRTLQLAAAEARLESLRHELDAVTTDLASLSLVNDALAAQLAASGPELKTLREELESTRTRAAKEQAQLAEDLAAAAAGTAALQAALDARVTEHAGALDEQRARLDAELEALARTVTVQQEDVARLRAERERWEVERSALVEQMVGAVEKADALQAALDAREQEHARMLGVQQARADGRIQELIDTVSRYQEEHAQLVAGRQGWDAERSSLLEQLADAVTTVDVVQTALDAREQEHVGAMAAERARYETLIAELIQASHDQHSEYQHVLAEQTAAREEECARAEWREAALLRERDAAERERTDVENRTRELEARIAVLDALCAAHETRHRTLQREAETLVAVLSTPVTASAHREVVAAFPIHPRTEHVVA